MKIKEGRVLRDQTHFTDEDSKVPESQEYCSGCVKEKDKLRFPIASQDEAESHFALASWEVSSYAVK